METALNHMLSHISCDDLLGVYLRPDDPDIFLVGNVIAWQAGSFICLKTIALEGTFDGYIMCNAEYIYRYEVNCSYLRQLSNASSRTTELLPAISGWVDYCDFAMRQQYMIQIIGKNGKKIACGLLRDYSTQNVTLQRIRRDGTEGQPCRFFLSNIAGIACCIAGGKL